MNLALKWSLIVIYIVTWSCYTFCFSCPHLWFNNERATTKTPTFINCNNYQSKDNSFSKHFLLQLSQRQSMLSAVQISGHTGYLKSFIKIQTSVWFFFYHHLDTHFFDCDIWFVCTHKKTRFCYIKEGNCSVSTGEYCVKFRMHNLEMKSRRRELILISAIILKSLSLSISISPISLSYFLYPPQTHTFTHKLFEYAKEESEREGEKKPTT